MAKTSKTKEEKKTILTELAQAFLASSIDQQDDQIFIRFDEKKKERIVPVARDFTQMLDDVDKRNVMEESGFEEEEDDYGDGDRDY